MKILFLENDDSYSWNVVDCLRCAGAEVAVRAGRDSSSISARYGQMDAVVIGPGPLDPIRAGLMEPLRRIIDMRVPLLGICLGHQAIGLHFGARLIRSAPAHGVTASIRFHDTRLFPDIKGDTEVMRYHSLALADIKAPLRTIAETQDGVAMAIEHETLPIAGLQFHPDSFATPRGVEMVAAFLRAVR